MPIDFDALPARTTVPNERTAVVPWLIALVLIVAISIATWPAGRSTQSPWFWIRAFVMPSLVWLVLYSGWRFVSAHRRRNALADNEAIDRKEKRLHGDASVPMAVIGQSWCFSGDAEKNKLKDAMTAREPADTPEEPRGLVIPDKAFFQGNHADEAWRQEIILEWLLVELVKPLKARLRGSTNPNASKIWLSIDSVLTAEATKMTIARAWTTLGLKLPVSVQLIRTMSLYSIDDWLDKRLQMPVHLVIAVQLRGAISGGMQAGEAEAGVAVLLGQASGDLPDQTLTICAHRPIRSEAATLDEGIANALRWGHCSDGNIDTLWDTGLQEPLAQAFKNLESSVNDAPVVELARTIGDVGVAAPWLALALAAARAKENAGAQLILDQQDGDVVAMICRKKN
ncbi:hypothetical protein FAZ69_31295 [Trinickia terrae]|uniref:Uncharacterized protein n=1 Tax=Trinickia terrae TaxID=2571161 RepID=A0A4U1HJX8_9BURK|nr:hypothetical protein [Trinickia terrae]TKC78926.1 hypothetical protein FAZ69_31295 [Trinickia terrae]